MNYFFLILTVFIPSSFVLADITRGVQVPETKAMSMEQAIQSFESSSNKEVVVKGEIKQVCQKKGCWMAMAAGKDEVRITFKDYGFFVPKNLQGSMAKMIGQVNFEEVSVKDQKHYLNDAGASKEEIAAVSSPKKKYTFVASGVKVYSKSL